MRLSCGDANSSGRRATHTPPPRRASCGQLEISRSCVERSKLSVLNPSCSGRSNAAPSSCSIWGTRPQATLLHANRVGVVGVLHRVVDFRTLQPAIHCSSGHPEGGGV